MSLSKPTKKRRVTSTSSSRASSSPEVRFGLSDCYNFLTINEYSEKTVGLAAFILRNTLGDIDFSDILNEYEKRSQQGQTVDFVALLEERRKKLPAIDALIGKCLMLNRLITYIGEDTARFMTLVSDIHEDIRVQMTDDQLYGIINYPEDFRQRERDFNKRKNAQNIRRLFYYAPIEAQAPSLIQLQNKTTSHLSYLIDTKMRYDPSFRETGLEEIIKIFGSSFMIIAQPHYGANTNPVLVRNGKRSEPAKAKVSVIIVSLLHDFMGTHPNMIELDDFEPVLCSPSNLYKLDKSEKLSWKRCELQINPDGKPRTILYAELSEITIKESRSTRTSKHANKELYTFTFPVTVHLNLPEYKISKTYQIPLESLSFAIGSHTDHISYFLTRIIIDDIRRFSQLQRKPITIQSILHFLHHYFIHRTGVEPKEDLRHYLEQELIKAESARKNCESLEDIFMDFLFPFVHRIEFMAKHPILAMFYEDGLFLGPCNSERVVEVMKPLANVNSPIVALRFNSIKIEYRPDGSTASSKSMTPDPCFVRVIIHNGRTENPQDHTFDPEKLSKDLLKFVSTANAGKAPVIRILSTLNDETNSTTFKSYGDFTKYYHDGLHDFLRNDEKHKRVTDFLLTIDDDSQDANSFD